MGVIETAVHYLGVAVLRVQHQIHLYFCLHQKYFVELTSYYHFLLLLLLEEEEGS